MKLSAINYRSIKSPENVTSDTVLRWLIQAGMIKYERLVGTVITPFGQLFTDSYRKHITSILKGSAAAPCMVVPYMKSETTDIFFNDLFEMYKFDYKSYKTLPAALQMMRNNASDTQFCQLHLYEEKNSGEAACEALEKNLNELTPQRLYKSTFGGIRTAYLENDEALDTLIICPECGYGSDPMLAEMPHCPLNNDKDVVNDDISAESDASITKMVEVYTPDVKTIQELAVFLEIESTSILKAIALMRSDGKPVVVIIAGNRTLSLPKLSRLTKKTYRMATDIEIETVFNAVPGFVGPIGLAASCQIIWDRSVAGIKDGVCGANKRDYHYLHVAADETRKEYIDVAVYEAGIKCPVCGSEMHLSKGDMLYELFEYGESLSENHRANYLDASGKAQKHYAFGIAIRMMTGLKSIIRNSINAGAEKCDFERSAASGINETCKSAFTIDHLAPFDVWLIVMNTKKEAQVQFADSLYAALMGNGIFTVYDDRTDSPGVKFYDAERFTGIPRIVVGKLAEDGFCDIQISNERFEKMTIAEAVQWVNSRYKPLDQQA
ncbi:MAG: prolyl-tRNA synthetase [Clostridiales bacterium]|jgi:prolyl-tRNA synthetase|nr:prolyl-tRNA synthetase [Clostridiales bacterium]